MLKRAVRVAVAVVALCVAVVACYAAYLQATYDRIADNQPIEVRHDPQAILSAGKQYTAVTYNVGFGAYTPDYTFFMDRGVMDDGTATHGTGSRAVSEQSVRACIEGDIQTLSSLDPDFILLQEVDVDSDRSYHVDQAQAFRDAFPVLGSAFCLNFHSAYLAYPPLDPHGQVTGGMLTLTGAHVDQAARRSYPVDESFPTKFFDLDRCFQVLRLPVDDGRELVLINSHMSAYDEGGTVRAKQLAMLSQVLSDEAAKGNYVVCGGDWNHALCGSADMYPSAQQVPSWVAELGDDDLPLGFSVVRATNLEQVPTCRGVDIPYQEGVTYTTTVDGFIVSDNVSATALNVDTGFATSDHNPVVLSFTLGGAGE